MSTSTGTSYNNKESLKQRRKHPNTPKNDAHIIDEHDTSKLLSKTTIDRTVDWCVSALLTMWTCYIRLWKISQPTSVVFDEVHFGGFASKYISKKFFMDVHPPLAKILITWAAQFAGFNGSFDFKEIGKDYLEPKVPYVFIRTFCALYGVMLVPIAYWTMRGCKFSVATAVLTALMICYENGFITNNRLILLDSILLFFTTLTLLMWINFRNQSRNAFKSWWWIWLFLTGTGLGLTVSSKWVGLFTIATIGVAVLQELWELWGDQTTKVGDIVKHFFARAFCLLVLPFLIYMACFKIHFTMLPQSGSGAAYMSPEFQASLEGVKFPKKTPVDIIYGAKIDIRHMATQGGYLHSHDHQYPGGSKQQQITLYSHVDENNWWVINKAEADQVNGPEYVKNGDTVRLTHLKTKRRLHTHDIRPTTNDQKYQYEATGYGYDGFEGDDNDNWKIEIVGSDVEGSRLRARQTQFRLISVNQKCALFSRKYKLPDWGFKQQEVTCMKDALLPKTIWMIETTESDLLPEGTEEVSYKTQGFLEKFLELNKVMWNVNQGLSASHTYGSRPNDWPGLRRGISFWSKDNLKIYLLGNPLVFWGSTFCVVAFFFLKLLLSIFAQRKLQYHQIDADWVRFNNAASFFFVSWALHYFPFNLMGRQLFLHHYMPSLYMGILVVGSFFELFTCQLYPRNRWTLVVICVVAIIYVYRIFIPITYAEPWTTQKCLSATWRPDWDFACKRFDKKVDLPDSRQDKKGETTLSDTLNTINEQIRQAGDNSSI